MALAGAVVLVVVVLLLGIIAQARGILAAAARSLGAVRAIRTNVEPIWDLAITNDVADRLVDGARGIEAKTRLLADSVEAHATSPTAAGA